MNSSLSSLRFLAGDWLCTFVCGAWGSSFISSLSSSNSSGLHELFVPTLQGFFGSDSSVISPFGQSHDYFQHLKFF